MYSYAKTAPRALLPSPRDLLFYPRFPSLESAEWHASGSSQQLLGESRLSQVDDVTSLSSTRASLALL